MTYLQNPLRLLNGNKKLLIFAVIFGVVSLFSGCSCEGGGSSSSIITGRVVNTSYNPVSGATITISNFTATTISDGTYTVSGLSLGTYSLSISASGYVSSSRLVEVTSGATSVPMIVLNSSDSKSTEIDNAGGVVTSSDGSIKLEIPSGAISTKTSISVSKIGLSGAPGSAPSGYKFIYLAYISPEMTLSKSATLTIPLLSEATKETTVPFYSFDSSSSSWKSISAGTVSTETSTISVSINKFGWIAAAMLLTTNPGIVKGYVKDSTGTAIANADVWISSSITQSDINGLYILENIPAGTYTVYAMKEGYNKNSTGVTAVSNSTVLASDIILSSVSATAGIVSGRITNSANAAAIEGARILVSGAKEAYSDSNGYYNVYDVTAGQTAVTAYATGYKYQTTITTVTAANTSTVNFSLVCASAESFYDDVEAGGNSWEVSGYWERTNGYKEDQSMRIENTLYPNYVTLPNGDKYLPSAHTGTWMWWYGKEGTGSYIGVLASSEDGKTDTGGTSTIPNQGSLISLPIDLTAYAYSTLTFWTWWEIESVNPSAGKDFMYIYVSSNSGQTWNQIGLLNPRGDPDSASKKAYLPYTSGGFNKPGVWVKYNFDLTTYVGNIIQIKFDFNTDDEKYNGFRGWCLDDISVTPTRISASSLSQSVTTQAVPPIKR